MYVRNWTGAKQLTQHPVSFLGEFFLSLLTPCPMNPLKLARSANISVSTTYTSTTQEHNSKTSGPQSISIE